MFAAGGIRRSSSGRRFVPILLSILALGGCRARRPATPTPQMDARTEFWVRVLLLDDVPAFEVGSPTGLRVVAGEQVLGQETSGSDFGQATDAIRVELREGAICVGDRSFAGDRVSLQTNEPHILQLNGVRYRGKLSLMIDPVSGLLDVVNLVPLEPYLAGVVGAEMPEYWEPEALKAQAIAARTYCLVIKKRFGVNRGWDLKGTQAHQVYGGLSAESSAIWSAVNQTNGKVLVCRQAGQDSEQMFPAYYSSTCGGHTEPSVNVFGDDYEPLQGVACPYCRDVARPKYFFWPMVQYDASDVSRRLLLRYSKLRELEEVKDIRVTGQSDYEGFSRLTNIQLQGSTGKRGFLRAEDLRLTVDPTGQRVKSTACEVVKMGDTWAFCGGRGYGHGVGMCQCGAQSLARRGGTAEEILAYYYPGSRIVDIYENGSF